MRLQTLLIILSLASGLASLMLAYISWQRRRMKGMGAFAALCLSAAIWSLFYMLEIQATDDSSILLWSRLKYTGAVFLPLAWFAFTVRYTDRYAEKRRIRYRHISLLGIIPVITVVLLWVGSGELIWQEYNIDYTGMFPNVDIDYGIWLVLIYTPYAILTTTAGFVLLVSKWLQPSYRRQLALLLIALMLPFLGTAIVFLSFSLIDPGAIFFGLSMVMLALGVLRINVFDIMPVAYNHVIENIPDGVLVLDNSNHIVAINTPLKEYAKSALPNQHTLIGQRIDEVFSDIPEELKPLLEEEDLARETFEITLDEDRIVETRVFPLRDERNYLIGRGVMFRNITSQRQVEDELNNRINQLKILYQADEEITRKLDLNSSMLFALDAAQRLSNADACFIAVTEDEHLRVHTVLGAFDEPMEGRIIQPDDGIAGRVMVMQEPEFIMDVHQNPDDQAMRSSTTAVIAIPLVTPEQLIGLMVLEVDKPTKLKDDAYQTMQLLASRIAIAIENAKLYEQTSSQLKELQQLYEQVSQLEQLKTDMIRIAAHDLKNPLSVVQGYMEMMLLDKDLLPEYVLDYVQSARKTASRMSQMIEDILSLERIEQMAQKGGATDPIDLRHVIHRLTESYQEQATDKSQSLRLHLPDNNVGDSAYEIMGDLPQVQEAISNLIGNAIKYTPDGGTVDVFLDYADDQTDCLVFRVVDTGYGIPVEQQERLFQPFFRAKTRETSEIHGTGLGLHLVKNIIERHGGEMIFRSTYGEGSTFGFRLPLNKNTADSTEVV